MESLLVALIVINISQFTLLWYRIGKLEAKLQGCSQPSKEEKNGK